MILPLSTNSCCCSAMTDIAKKLGACWADMKDAEKAKYEQQAKVR